MYLPERCSEMSMAGPNGVTITALQGEGHVQLGTALTIEFNAVGTLTRIAGFHRNTACARMRQARLFDTTFRQEAVIPHHTVDPLHIDLRKEPGFKGLSRLDASHRWAVR